MVEFGITDNDLQYLMAVKKKLRLRENSLFCMLSLSIVALLLSFRKDHLLQSESVIGDRFCSCECDALCYLHKNELWLHCKVAMVDIQ